MIILCVLQFETVLQFEIETVLQFGLATIAD